MFPPTCKGGNGYIAICPREILLHVVYSHSPPPDKEWGKDGYIAIFPG